MKAKILNCEKLLNTIQDDINYHKKEVNILKSEKETLESVLNQKASDVKKSLTTEVARVDEEKKITFQG